MSYNAVSGGGVGAGSREQFVDFSFCESKDINEPVSVRIDSLWGKGERRPGVLGQYSLEDRLRLDGLGFSLPDDCEGLEADESGSPLLFVTAQLESSGIPLSLPLQTKHRHMEGRFEWFEWIRFPTKYSELAIDARVSL
ncbi:Phosphatidylinositol (PI) 3-kinase, partial [Coemansia sp. RSA 2598]